MGKRYLPHNVSTDIPQPGIQQRRSHRAYLVGIFKPAIGLTQSWNSEAKRIENRETPDNSAKYVVTNHRARLL